MSSCTNAARAARERRRREREAASVIVGPGWRVRPLDDRNWVVEQERGQSWKVRGYYSRAADACAGAARLMLDREVRSSLQHSVAAADLAWRIDDAEARVAAAMRERVG